MNIITRNGLNVDITMTRGDSLYAAVTMEQNGQPYEPEEGDAVRFAVSSGSATVIYKEIPLDTMVLHLKPEDTKKLFIGTYPYDIQLTTAGGDVDTFVRGLLRLLREVE